MDNQGKTWIITGASQGIGLVLVKKLLAQGCYTVIRGTINGYFEAMYREDRREREDKKQALLLNLQMLLLESQRAGRNRQRTAVPEGYGYIYHFLSLLESAFQVQERDNYVKLKTASEFADQLHVHPNYLNALVKNHTGKTLREHIQGRLLHEAKSLLVQTNWGINEISDGLGFSGQAAFTSFFKKKTNISPSEFRKTSMLIFETRKYPCDLNKS
jgi:AraC family transcriptional activator of pobA